jgi:hypothetical protein
MTLQLATTEADTYYGKEKIGDQWYLIDQRTGKKNSNGFWSLKKAEQYAKYLSQIEDGVYVPESFSQYPKLEEYLTSLGNQN